MSTNTNTDLTEEDAADLQFPKEQKLTVTPFITNKNTPIALTVSSDNEKCSSCKTELNPPYIQCAECHIDICSACFANGVEFFSHRNDHNYRVIRNDFVLFEKSDWTAKEELALLDSLLKFNNWKLIAKDLPGRSEREIKHHYDKFYLERRGSNLFPQMPEHENVVYPLPVIPYKFKLSGIEEPPRFAANTVGYNCLAGYNPARSDFELEYDAHAEELLSNLKFEPVARDDPHHDLINDLQCAIVMSYNRRLKERQRRKQIIRNHGLILLRKTIASLHRYDMTITRPVCERLMAFKQFFKNGDEFDYMMEGLHRAGELKMQISKLCDFRKKGIKTLAGAQLYLQLKQSHDDSLEEVKKFQSDPRLNLNKNPKVNIMPPTKKRGTFTPIEIIGMPGYEKLLPKEMDLCRNVRLVPLSYIELRDTLIAENKKLGYLKLQTARRLLKIDVNKTRRLYDFLVQEGYINKPK